ncbi:MAG: hypothetical protein WDO56_27865 [Gammaproteobacteria bacterium]
MLVRLKQSLSDGSLRQIKPADTPFALNDIRNVPESGPWPDYVEAYFEDRSGQRYKLVVEAYHGAGGSWERI